MPSKKLSPVHLERRRPSTRRAYLGRFAPLFYDEANMHEVYGRSVPNAVLENATGLMLCYDELWFAHRALCPADMQNLDFVHFVSDQPELLRTARDILEEGQRVAYSGPIWHILPTPRTRSYIADAMAQINAAERLREHLTQTLARAGYQTSLELLPGNDFQQPSRTDGLGDPWPDVQVAWAKRARQDVEHAFDWLVADALQIGPMDCIANTRTSVLLGQPSEAVLDAVGFHTYQLEAMERVLHIRTTEALTPRGPYHEFIGDLRKDKRIKDLRALLAGMTSANGSAAALVEEVECLIQSYLDEAFRSKHRPALLRAVGSAALSMAGNQLLPGLGGVLGSLVNADRVISDHHFKKSSRWAMFILDARDKRQPSAQRPMQGEPR
ncbi:hypothetical protein ACGFZZ_33735 [Streptomyces tendae]|uniref:hypothetical protein n=1 Tax=Streptomyces tendae TaxID=1932 RepID=UPI0037120467